MDRATKTGIWIIATGVILTFLHFGRSILAPFALAVFLFLVIEGFATMIDNWSRALKIGHARVFAVLIVLGGFFGFMALLANGIAEFGRDAGEYENRINDMIADMYEVVHMSGAPTLQELLFNETGQRFFATIANETGDLSGDLVLILIYVAFLFLAQSSWTRKLDNIFPGFEQRAQVRQVGDEARRSIETYLWTQTVISALITALTYFSLLALGVQNALFLSALIFVLNYIPTVGSIVAALVPPLFAIVQPELPAWVPGTPPQDNYIYAAIVFAAVSFWQFSIGNFIQPRMMGESLNLSALVVLLSLAIWGAIWGIPGMFLSAPLTVLMMIFFAQSSSTRWIAILLSADGNPQGKGTNTEPPGAVSAAQTYGENR
ncbi:MAG: AI-2E family transporter [Hyphomonas sp.]|jgi:predicted PurR-regulated permease PerM|uniref:AI-2E family transporter n=1 Tax=unclassified Hyphomonas TaxID=2630699 RepID=UPI001B004B66|nr:MULTISPECIES: AI-2E family transporter [unclassified Hyphomonas]MBO6581512.1 AI-2E family transporter [Hyphomonas sp.]